MRKLASLFVVLGMCTMPAFGAPETFKDAPMVDVNCSAKAAANPDAHTRACALQCEKNGFGIFTEDNKFLKFDAEGNSEIVAALRASKKKDHLRVDVTGDVHGDTLQVTSVKLR